MAKLRITYYKSANGFREDQKRTIAALGFKRLNQTLDKDANEAIKGMVFKVKHLLRVEEI
jgi:large subunit ribosomal protein L30